MATTTAHLYTRLYEILCDGAGVTRALPTAHRFARMTTTTASAQDLAVRARVQPFVQVIIDPISAAADDAGELHNAHLYMLQVRIVRRYYYGHAADASAVETAHVRAADDLMRTRAALCHPSNLIATEAGDATGLGGNALSAADARSQVRSVDALPTGRDRLLTITDTYGAAFDFTGLTDHLLTEAGTFLVKEDGGYLLLE